MVWLIHIYTSPALLQEITIRYFLLLRAMSSDVLNSVRDALDADDIDDWAIVGDEAFAKDKISEYEERLGLTYLIARGRISGIEDSLQIASHESLAKLMQL